MTAVPKWSLEGDWFYSSADEMNDAYERRTGRSGKSILKIAAEAREQGQKKSK